MDTIAQVIRIKKGTRKYQMLELVVEENERLNGSTTKADLIRQWHYCRIDPMSLDVLLKKLVVTGLVEKPSRAIYKITVSGLEAYYTAEASGIWFNENLKKKECKECGKSMDTIKKENGFFKECECGNREWFR